MKKVGKWVWLIWCLLFILISLALAFPPNGVSFESNLILSQYRFWFHLAKGLTLVLDTYMLFMALGGLWHRPTNWPIIIIVQSALFIGAVALAPCAWLFPILPVGLIVFIAVGWRHFQVSFSEPWVWVVVLCLCFLLPTFYIGAHTRREIRSRESELSVSFHQVQIAIANYRVDTGSYPPTLNALVQTGTIDFLPRPPFVTPCINDSSGFSKWRTVQQSRCLACSVDLDLIWHKLAKAGVSSDLLNDYRKSTPTQMVDIAPIYRYLSALTSEEQMRLKTGNLFYLPVDKDGDRKFEGYYLGAFAPPSALTRGQDVLRADGVIGADGQPDGILIWYQSVWKDGEGSAGRVQPSPPK